jgi:hypothetical protein
VHLDVGRVVELPHSDRGGGNQHMRREGFRGGKIEELVIRDRKDRKIACFCTLKVKMAGDVGLPAGASLHRHTPHVQTQTQRHEWHDSLAGI